MLKFFLICMICLPGYIYAQDFQATFHIRHLPEENRPLLLRLYNGNLFMVDSLPVRKGDSLIFTIPEHTPQGMLRVVLGSSALDRLMNKPPVNIDLLFSHENICIDFDFMHPDTSLQVTCSAENRIYYDFLRTESFFFRKLGLLEQIISNYPEPDEFYQKAKEYYKKIQLQRDKYIDKTYTAHRNTLSGKIIKNMKMPLTEGSSSPAIRDSILQNEFLSKVDFSDTLLLYTNVYTDKIFRYIQLFMKRDASPRANEANCIRALDKLVPRIAENPVVQQHLMQFLIDGFERMNMEEVLAHISSNYLQQCGSSSDVIKRRLEAYHKMAVGQVVPDFTIYDINGQPFNLYSSLSPYTLLLFWHTGCSHCQLMMNELPLLEKQDVFSGHQIKIIGISIDENEEEWKKFSSRYPLNWINTREAGFESQIATDYNLFATPSMFLLDENHKIIAKPTTIGELRTDIEKIK